MARRRALSVECTGFMTQISARLEADQKVHSLRLFIQSRE